MGAVNYFFYTIATASVLLFVFRTRGQTIQIEHEEGSTVSLNFNVSYRFGLLQLKRNDNEIYRSDEKEEPGRSVSLTRRDVVMFTLETVEIRDSGIYKCFLSGLEKPPVYDLEVISSEKFIGISKNFENWDPYQVNETIYAIEDATLRLACRVNGGLRSNCFIKWRIHKELMSPFKKNVTACDRYHEESVLEIETVSVNLDGSRISCESGELSTSIVVRTKKLWPSKNS